MWNMKNKAAFMSGIDRMIIKEIEMPKAKAGYVVVKLEYVGICGSDIHYFHSGKCGSYIVPEGQEFILGHEGAGTIVEIGEGCKKFKVGDRVALEPGITCGECEFCKNGQYNLCPNVHFLATPPVHGCYMNYIAFPENMCFKLPENVSTKEGALIEPLSVGLHAAKQGNVTLGDTVIILGGGCIGLMTMMACKAYGASTLIVVDLVDARLKKAKELGATYTINATKMNMEKEILYITGGVGADKVFETAGSVITVAQTPFLVKRGGNIVLVGLASEEEVKYNFAQIMDKEATIKSVFRYRNIYPQAIAGVSSGTLPVQKVVTHEFDLDHIQQAFEKSINNKTDLVKAVIKIN